jgi:Flp pilus assembly protein TadB
MGKRKRDEKRARRKARGTERERQFQQAEQRRKRVLRRRRYTVAAIPLVTLLAAGGLYYGLSDPRAAGIALLLGALAFLLYGLSTLGSNVQPRDRHQAGSIDFGRKG